MGKKVYLLDSEVRKVDASKIVPRDNVAGVLPVLSHAHHEIHEGSGFTSCKKFTHGVGASPNMLIVTPNTNKYAHFTFQVVSDDVMQVDFYEAPDYAGGSAVSSFNRDRNNTKDASGLTLTADATDSGSGKGTLIWTFKAGANKTVTSSESERFEFILAKDKKYLLEAVGANGDLITVLLEWYEHTSGDFDGMQ